METEMATSHSEIIQILEATVGKEWVKTNPDDLETYGRDWTKFFPPDPLAAVFPEKHRRSNCHCKERKQS